ncbi:hypothetical protein EDB89DRAFT_483098 [Lactarius sanguifluus]|nr:hypothetical protein EDB89DRAFT_483098 [Lactarius sanguifluus]
MGGRRMYHVGSDSPSAPLHKVIALCPSRQRPREAGIQSRQLGIMFKDLRVAGLSAATSCQLPLAIFSTLGSSMRIIRHYVIHRCSGVVLYAQGKCRVCIFLLCRPAFLSSSPPSSDTCTYALRGCKSDDGPACRCGHLPVTAVSQSVVKGFTSKHIPSHSLPCGLFHSSSPALIHVTSSTCMPLADDRIGATHFVSTRGTPDPSFQKSHLHPSRRAPDDANSRLYPWPCLVKIPTRTAHLAVPRLLARFSDYSLRFFHISSLTYAAYTRFTPLRFSLPWQHR